MPEPATPREVFEHLLDGVTGKKWDELPDLYAEDTMVEHPFAVPEPTRLEGRDQVRRHFAGAAEMPLEMRADNVVVHGTADPEVIVAEFDYHGRVTTDGRTFTASNILVMRVRDGQIVSSRDYHNHHVLAEALRGAHESGVAAG